MPGHVGEMKVCGREYLAGISEGGMFEECDLAGVGAWRLLEALRPRRPVAQDTALSRR